MATDRIHNIISKLSSSKSNHGPTRSSSSSQLAGAYAERAMLFLKLHRHHHALFDIQEALRLDCSNTKTQMLLVQVKRLMAMEEKEDRGTTTCHADDVMVPTFDDNPDTFDDNYDIHLDF